MYLLSIYRSLIFALQSLWRNIWLSVITVFIIILTFLSLNFLVGLNFLAQSAIAAVKDKVDISIYFKPEVRAEAIDNIKGQIMGMSQVKEVTLTTAEQNLATFQQRHQNNQVITDTLQALGNNPLGSTLIIRAKNIADYPIILAALDKPEFNELLEDKGFESHDEIIAKIDSMTSQTRSFGVGISLVFALIVTLIVFNTIRIAIFSHRDEIAIMKLVGASNWFVRAPFLVESFFYALIGVILGTGLLFLSLWLIQPHLTAFFGDGNFNLLSYYQHYCYIIIGAEFGFLALLSMITAGFALSKYLKV
jgi:cell division transport system permease protein